MTTTHYVLDPGAGLTQVLADGTNTYLYGNDRLAQYQATMQYLGADGLGSVRQLFDASAQVVGSSRYDPFGNVMSQSGATSVFAFAGEQYDATGLTYLRARYYSSSQGRFVTEDTAPGNDTLPLSLHLYAYAWDNPTNRVDPSGQQVVPPLLCSPGQPCPGGLLSPEQINAIKALLAAIGPAPKQPVRPAVRNACDPYERADLTGWMVDELNANRKSGLAEFIRMSLWSWQESVSTNPIGGVVAYAVWADTVKTNGLWDYKAKIKSIVGTNIQLGGRWTSYETPANINFGYVGKAVGFGEETLHCGADWATNREWCSRADSHEDYAEIEVGFELLRLSGGGDVNEQNLKGVLDNHPDIHATFPMEPREESLSYLWPYPVGTFDDGSSGILVRSR